MSNEMVVLGKKYVCRPIGLKGKVIGEVVNKLEKCIVLCVEQYDACDHEEILEKCGKVVVKYEDIYSVNALEMAVTKTNKKQIFAI